MFYPAVTTLINLLGFVFGASLYALLLLMVIRHPVRTDSDGGEKMPQFSFDWLLLATDVLGLIWNLGGLIEWLSRDLLDRQFHLFFLAANAALGFLPVVVVHSVLRESDEAGEQKFFKFAIGLNRIAPILSRRTVAA